MNFDIYSTRKLKHSRKGSKNHGDRKKLLKQTVKVYSHT